MTAPVRKQRVELAVHKLPLMIKIAFYIESHCGSALGLEILKSRLPVLFDEYLDFLPDFIELFMRKRDELGPFLEELYRIFEGEVAALELAYYFLELLKGVLERSLGFHREVFYL